MTVGGARGGQEGVAGKAFRDGVQFVLGMGGKRCDIRPKHRRKKPFSYRLGKLHGVEMTFFCQSPFQIPSVSPLPSTLRGARGFISWTVSTSSTS